MKRLLRTSLRIVLGVPVALFLIATALQYAYFYYPERANGTIVSLGMEREYLLHVPKGYDPAKRTPLVISLHPALLWPATQRAISRWDRLADEHGFLVVYPAGRSLWNSGTGIGGRIWALSPDVPQLRDVRYVSDLIDKLQGSYNVDPDRIYADGISNGGSMAFALACTLSHRIAAVGTVAAAQELPFSWCSGDRRVPVLSFHGTADAWAPYTGAAPNWLSEVPFADIAGFTQAWARKNGCAERPAETAIAADVTRIRYNDCADGADVILYRVEGGGHSWPGGGDIPRWFVGPTTRSVDATELLWRFYLDHPLRSSARPAP